MKLGRPRVKTEERKGKIAGARFTDTERQLLERAAAGQKQNLSKWMRSVLLERAGVHANMSLENGAVAVDTALQNHSA
jgi:uncharacterized protein (DUF1778 family)